VLVAIADEVVDGLFGDFIDVDIVRDHLLVISVVVLKELLVLKIYGAIELLIGVPIACHDILQKLVHDFATGLPHILRISCKESATHAAAPPLEILRRILDERLGNIVNIARGKLVPLHSKGLIQMQNILIAHPLNTDVNPGEMRGAKGILVDRLREHNIARKTEEIITGRIAIVKLIGMAYTIRNNLFPICGKGVCARDLELVKVPHNILGLLLQMCGAHALQEFHIALLAIDD
jgi:hypothetical protein